MYPLDRVGVRWKTPITALGRGGFSDLKKSGDLIGLRLTLVEE
jgi:hypothetical protein